MTGADSRDNGGRVQPVRHLLAQRHLALLICAAAMLLKLLVPTGYMVASEQGRLIVTLCPGVVSDSPAMPMAMPGMDHAMPMAHGTIPDGGRTKDHGKAEMPCAFAGLSAQVLGAVDIVLLVVALALVARRALCTRPRVVPRAALYLRPPLRGPPLTA